MCPPGCREHVNAEISRRRFLGSAVAATALAGCFGSGSQTKPAVNSALNEPRSFSRVIDLSHTLTPRFPTYTGQPHFRMESIASLKRDGYEMNRWVLNEHTCTHVDAPSHFFEGGLDLSKLAVQDLVVPLVVVDIRKKAREDADAMLTIKDLQNWEAQHGNIPSGACVAMLSGWDAFAQSDAFRNSDSQGTMHFPGFHGETADFLLRERQVSGIGVDTLSLDQGKSKDFLVHRTWLPANRWGIECMANLGQIPASGATLVVGVPKVAGASGGPARLVALV